MKSVISYSKGYFPFNTSILIQEKIDSNVS